GDLCQGFAAWPRARASGERSAVLRFGASRRANAAYEGASRRRRAVRGGKDRRLDTPESRDQGSRATAHCRLGEESNSQEIGTDPIFQDRYGLALTTASAEARDAYVAGVDCLLAANAGVEQHFRRAIEADPAFALAQIG